MNVLVVHAHPEPRSFCSALARTAERAFASRGAAVVVSDLYAMGFDPVTSRRNFTSVKDPDYFKPQAEEAFAIAHDGFAPDVAAEMEKVRRADVILFTFPLWWHSLPAILKGWVDRVFAMGFAYGRGRMFETGPFRGKRGMLVLTTGGAAPDDPSEIARELEHVEQGVFAFSGMAVEPAFVAWGAAHVDDERRRLYLVELERRLEEVATRVAAAGCATAP